MIKELVANKNTAQLLKQFLGRGFLLLQVHPDFNSRQIPGKVIQRDDGPGKTLHSLNLQSYAYICIGSLEPSIHLHRCLANPDSTWTIGLRTRSGY
jgi:hypothetical protein